MATITTAELIETGEKRDGSGRRLMPAERRRELIAGYRRSGLTMAAFARREGLRYSTFAGWVLQEDRRRAPAVRFAEVKLGLPPTVPDAGLEVRMPDGTLLRGGRAAELAALVRALRA